MSYSDYGGDLVKVLGTWPIQGPYQIRLRQGATFFPSSGGCYSALVGQADACQTDVLRRVLTFSLPPLDYGTYDLIIGYGPGFGITVALLGAIEIVPRDWALEVWGIRNTFPDQPFNLGGKTPRQTAAPAAHPVTVPLMNNIQSITRAFGLVQAETFSNPYTRLTAALLYNGTTATVESTLGFPESGTVTIGTSRFTYTGRTSTTLTGLTLVGLSTLATLPAFTGVVLTAHTLLAT